MSINVPNPNAPPPRLIAWELTRRCVLSCRHCRAGGDSRNTHQELTSEECLAVMDSIARLGRPTLILTGGEPLLRSDIFELAGRAGERGFGVVLATCGLLLDGSTCRRLADSGVKRLSVSLDGARGDTHDTLRGQNGAFKAALRGIRAARDAGLGFQINTTVTRLNLDELPEILELAVKLGADAFNPFMFVPVGRGAQMARQSISPDQYEHTLQWLACRQGRSDIVIRVTCAPHYQRIIRQMGKPSLGVGFRGCMAGETFAFISHRGTVQPCGFLELDCGDLRKNGFDFGSIWRGSDTLVRLRNHSAYGGKCGLCEYLAVCGGCRARAFASSGDWLGEEPFCTYKPAANRPFGNTAKDDQPPADQGIFERLDSLDKRLLSAVQNNLPAESRPFEKLARQLGLNERAVLEKLRAWRQAGLIRRIGAVFDSFALGYVSTLLAAKVPDGCIEQAAQIVNSLPGVTHNYLRDGEFNLWFTLACPSAEEFDKVLKILTSHPCIEEIHPLPALRVYKISAEFILPGCQPTAGLACKSAPSQPVELTEAQKQLIRLIQQDIPLVERPFKAMADQLGCDEPAVVKQISDWLEMGVIRRFGAVLAHRSIGLKGNGMAVLVIDNERIDRLGEMLAGLAEVSHCYHRPAWPGWPYNLYAMVHSRSEEEVRILVEGFARSNGINDFRILFTRREFQKKSMSYFVLEE